MSCTSGFVDEDMLLHNGHMATIDQPVLFAPGAKSAIYKLLSTVSGVLVFCTPVEL